MSWNKRKQSELWFKSCMRHRELFLERELQHGWSRLAIIYGGLLLITLFLRFF